MRIKLTISYDGTAFCGWQIQKNGRSVQGVLEEAIEKVTGEKSRPVGSGRTDAGVHALGQVAHFDLKDDCTIPPEKLFKAINTYLPEDVKAIKSERVSENFNAVKSAKKKTYVYSFYFSDVVIPVKDRYAENLYFIPDLKKMKECAEMFIGEHDFKGFMASGSSVKTTVRKIYSFKIKKSKAEMTFSVTGNGFLYNMVRILSGVVIEYSQDKITAADIEKSLKTGERIKTKTLSAKGLCLYSVKYKKRLD